MKIQYQRPSSARRKARTASGPGRTPAEGLVPDALPGGPRPRKAEANGTVQSLQRALSLLEALADARGEIGVAELSRRVGLHVSTTHRLLATLIPPGYVRQNPDSGGYGLGHKTFQLAEAYIGQIDLRQAIRPILERLSQATGETANLVIRDGREALYLDKVESPRSLRIFSRIGRRAPLHCTAVGKVLLASSPQAGVEALLGEPPFERLTRRTITLGGQLRRELAGVRAQGFAVDREECEEGACCLAAPVRNVTGETVAAVGISGPAVRMTPRRIQELIPVIVHAGREMSERLGFQAQAPTDTPAVSRTAGNLGGR